ncbi:ester cyclase [Arthrobacter sp. ISL-69]|uniref:ester cyclase n=1 Tax=Arthrobacter sp. ISL-69 TaxID=2819113 RepID=UPI001BE73A3F|nr:ester cyclase [Arthrobacter sp. ISL-69]MBT2535368.1 ester cyclase [Arthrobacter sp. ISL-69]
MAEGTGLIRRFYEEVLVGGNLDLIDESVLEGMQDHEDPMPGQPPGRDGVKFYVNAIRAAFPDLTVKLDPVLADGDLEAAHGVLSGTHKGEFLGIPASGKSVEFSSVDIIRIEDGKVAEHWGASDTLSLMQQIGAVAA